MYKLVVLFSVLAAAAAKPSVVAPLAYSAVVSPAVSSVSQYSSSVVHGHSPVLAPALYGAAVRSAALSLAPNTPAVVLGPHGVPLDTPDVVAARAAHFQAKALSGVHYLHKRSIAAPVAYSSVVAPAISTYSAPLVSAYSAPLVSAYSAPLVSAPLAYTSHVIAPKAYSVHPW